MAPIAIVNRGTFNGSTAGQVSSDHAAATAAALDAATSVKPAAENAAGTGAVSNASVSTGTGLRTITHGNQLLPSDVGPWAIQGVSKGSETLSSLSGPGRGYWRFDTPNEFSSSSAWPSNANDSNPSVLNDTTLHAGTVTGSPVTIDGYSIPVGTRIVQFYDFPDGYDFLAQGTSLKILFRGCRFRWSGGVGGTGIFNDNTSTSSQQIMLHFCDIGLQSMDPTSGECLMHLKFLGGLNHRMLRNYHTRSATFMQPNTQGCEITECYVDEYIYGFGEAGTSGSGGSSILHLNGISSEGGLTSIKILRNHILCPSPDGSTGSSGSSAGQIGYGTQPGQTGYGNGTAPGRKTTQTDCIALFSSNGLSNIGDGTTGLQIKDNLLGGSGYPVYLGNSKGDCENVVVTGNRVTTKWWTNGGYNGVATDIPTWGSNGNTQSDNLWADDYGTGGDGTTAIADRQYPAGNGPRTGTSFL